MFTYFTRHPWQRADPSHQAPTVPGLNLLLQGQAVDLVQAIRLNTSWHSKDPSYRQCFCDTQKAIDSCTIPSWHSKDPSYRQCFCDTQKAIDSCTIPSWHGKDPSYRQCFCDTQKAIDSCTIPSWHGKDPSYRQCFCDTQKAIDSCTIPSWHGKDPSYRQCFCDTQKQQTAALSLLDIAKTMETIVSSRNIGSIIQMQDSYLSDTLDLFAAVISAVSLTHKTQ